MTVLSCLHEAMRNNRFVLVDKIHVQVTRVKKIPKCTVVYSKTFATACQMSTNYKIKNI